MEESSNPVTPSVPTPVVILPPTPPSPQGPTIGANPTPSSAGYPVHVSVDYPDKQSRLLAVFSLPYFLIRGILLIPQIIVLYIIVILVAFAAWFNMFVIVFTGHSSPGLHKFVVGGLRWSTRVSAYLYGLTDKYPPFSLQD